MVYRDATGELEYEKTIKDPKPLDPNDAAERLLEVKKTLDKAGVVFWLGSGTCLGAIREGRFIPWDDEMDVASVIGLHGLTEGIVYEVAESFRASGFFVRFAKNDRYISVNVVKSGIRADWTCHRIINNDMAIEFPGVKLPLSLFANLLEIEFIGQRFWVPNPPEEYLRLKYGVSWQTPTGPGFELDVVGKIHDGELLGFAQKIRCYVQTKLLGWYGNKNRIKILDKNGLPVSGAEVILCGITRSRANKNGWARIYVPDERYYALIIKFEGNEEVLYEEILAPGGSYTYRPGPTVTAKEHYKAGVRAMALTQN